VLKTSADMWQALPNAGLTLFEEFRRVRKDLWDDLKDQPKEALEALDGVCDHLFSVQMRALNALRAEFTIKLRAKLADPAVRADDKTIVDAARVIFRDTLFDLLQVVVVEAWLSVTGGLLDAANAIAQDKFFSSGVWTAIAAGLEALGNMIPPPLNGKLDLASIAQTVIEKILEKGVTWAFTKIFFKLEGALFKQG